MTPDIISLAKQFRISVLSTGKFAVSGDLNNEEYLLEVLRAEQAAREERAIKDRLKQARLPAFKSFEEFDTDFQKGVTRKQLDLLAKLEWIDGLYNLILIGPPGAGKAHTALATPTPRNFVSRGPRRQQDGAGRLQRRLPHYGRSCAYPENPRDISKVSGTTALDKKMPAPDY